MFKKNIGISQILITLAMIFSAFVSKYNAFLFLASIFFIGALVSYAVCNFSIRNTLCMSACAIIFYTVTSFVEKTLSPGDAFTLVMLFIPGFVMGCCFKANLSFKDTFTIALSVDFLILIVVLAVTKFVFKINITAQLRDVFLSDFDDKLNLLKSMSPEVFAQISTNEHQLFNTLYVLIPGLIPFATSLLFVFTFLIQYGIAKLMCMEYLVRSSSFKDGFDCFRPGIVTNITMILMLATIMYETSLNTVMICINLALFILLMYFITSLSFIDHMLKRRGFYPGKRFGLMIAIIAATIFLTLSMPVANFIFIFIFFGFLDSLFDFRKLKTKKVD